MASPELPELPFAVIASERAKQSLYRAIPRAGFDF